MSTGKPPKTPPTEVEDLDLSGRTIGDFRVLRRLGQGGMGQVYLAEQISLRRNVALKILRPDMASNPKALARFKVEAEAVARATHANIVQIHALGEQDGLVYLAMEYVEGRNLKDYIARKGTPDLPVVLSIMRQVAAALQRAGTLGLIHRDIKPENILLTRKGQVKVADFGLVKDPESATPFKLTATGVTMGTPLYMSPEQVEGRPLDPRSDIYSFGVTCYYMLSGQPPFRGETAYEVALQHVQNEPVPLDALRPDLPEGLCAVIRKMMAKDPARRYQNGKELLRDINRLRESLAGVHPSGPPPLPVDHAAVNTLPGVDSTTALPTPSSSRGWLAVAVVLSLLLAAGAGMAIAWAQKSRQVLPHGQEVKAVGAIEKVSLPSQREQELREAVDRHLEALRAQQPGEPNGLDLCAELALLYLDSGRFDEAGKLFGRLEKILEPRGHRLLGRLGIAIVGALNNDVESSIKQFQWLFGPMTDPKKKYGEADAQTWEKAKLEPIIPLLAKPRWRYWINRAQWYNERNDLPVSAVPAYLIFRFPLGVGTGKGDGIIAPFKRADKGGTPKKPQDRK